MFAVFSYIIEVKAHAIQNSLPLQFLGLSVSVF